MFLAKFGKFVAVNEVEVVGGKVGDTCGLVRGAQGEAWTAHPLGGMRRQSDLEGALVWRRTFSLSYRYVLMCSAYRDLQVLPSPVAGAQVAKLFGSHGMAPVGRSRH